MGFTHVGAKRDMENTTRKRRTRRRRSQGRSRKTAVTAQSLDCRRTTSPKTLSFPGKNTARHDTVRLLQNHRTAAWWPRCTKQGTRKRENYEPHHRRHSDRPEVHGEVVASPREAGRPRFGPVYTCVWVWGGGGLCIARFPTFTVDGTTYVVRYFVFSGTTGTAVVRHLTNCKKQKTTRSRSSVKLQSQQARRVVRKKECMYVCTRSLPKQHFPGAWLHM